MATESNSACREPQRTNEISQSPRPTGDSQTLPNLPCEIIVEILLRLPVKSLLRLICVCKSWRSLISNPKFAKTHLSLASMKTDYTHHRLILTNWYLEVNHVKSCSLYSILNENSDSAVDLDCPLKAPKHSVMVWGCCDGLMCIGYGRQVFLWNPSTRKYKGLPIVEEPYPICVKFGFGYDECIDDYKVVGFFFENYTRGSEPKVKVNMYTLRSNSWRRIEDCPDRLPPNAWTFVNRALHWISTKSNRIIFSLDLVKETYGEVSEPEYRGGYCDDFSLGVLNGCLCILSSHFVCFDVWVMKEYGIRDSWTKLVVIPSVSHPRGYEYTAALCILENGEVLLDFVTHLIRYNPENGTFIYPVIRNCSPRFVAYTVIESLVSLDSDAHSGVPWQHHY